MPVSSGSRHRVQSLERPNTSRSSSVNCRTPWVLSIRAFGMAASEPNNRRSRARRQMVEPVRGESMEVEP